MGIQTNGRTWSVGPITITLPLFDAGAAKAKSDSAMARHEAAKAIYAGRLRTAVQEVESALVSLRSATQRAENALVAAEGYERAFIAMTLSYEEGVASLLDIEDARRSSLASQSALIDLRRDQLIAWVALYRSLGGGWSAVTPPPGVSQRSAFGGMKPRQLLIADFPHRSLHDKWNKE